MYIFWNYTSCTRIQRGQSLIAMHYQQCEYDAKPKQPTEENDSIMGVALL